MFAAIAVLAFLPWLDTSKVKSSAYRPLHKQFFWAFVVVCVMLGWLGSKPAEYPYTVLSLIFTGLYFAYFLVVLPLLGLFETPKPLPASIADAVLEKHKKGGAPVTAGAAAAPQTKG